MAGTEDEFAIILDNGLRSIRSDQETLDSVIRRYPEYAELLRPPLEAAAWLQARRPVFDPPPGFMPASRRRLLARIQFEKRSHLPGLARGGRWMGDLLRSRELFFQVLMLAALAALLVFLNWSLTLAAKNSIPGDPLYKVKLAQEQIQLALSLSEVGDGYLTAEFAGRRLVEISLLMVEERYDLLPFAVENFEWQLDRAFRILSAIAALDEGQAQTLSTSLEMALSEETEMLAALYEASPVEDEVGIRQALESAAGGVLHLQRKQWGDTRPASGWTPRPAIPETP